MPAMTASAASDLLHPWEYGRNRHPLDRALLLYALALPETNPDLLADQPLGRRNAALLQLRLETFGPRLRAYLDCPQCGERLEFEQNASDLLDVQPTASFPVVVDGFHFRPPNSRDLAQIVGEPDVELAARSLLQHCLIPTDDTQSIDDAMLPSIDRVESALEEADPLADLSFDFTCEMCKHVWSAPFDIAHYLWEEVEAQATRLLDDVHHLAQAYGWREQDILALSELRRTAYLERVLA